jgi:Mrp family chromosome partitioning ATPase
VKSKIVVAVPQKLAVIQLTETLSFLPAGKPDPDPMTSLTSDRMKAVLEEAAEQFDWVIVDTPPIGLVPDASLIAGMVDTTLFVVRAGKTPFSYVGKGIEMLGKDRIFGVLLNGVAEADTQGYETYYAAQ